MGAGPLEKEIPIGNQHFLGGYVSFREGRTLQIYANLFIPQESNTN